MRKALLAIQAALLISGCASQIELSKTPLEKPSNVTVRDNRTPEKLLRKHDALFSAVVFVEDTRFSPRAVDLYVAALSKIGTQQERIELEIDDFRVADFYPVRLGAGGQGFLGKAIFDSLIDRSTDWGFVNDMQLARNSNAVVCVVVGKLNGVPLRVAVSEPYKESPFAGLVYNDPDFRRALSAALDRAAADSLRQATQGAR